jgi:YHS domain-containing protein
MSLLNPEDFSMIHRRTRLAAVGASLAIAFTSLGSIVIVGMGPETPTPRPYPLATCPVSGEELGSMGEPVVKVYDGREVRFCCDDCVGKFEADKAKYWNKADDQIIAEQLMHYPLDTCIVSGHELAEEGDHAAVNVVYDNRLVRLCCADCEEDIAADPQAFMTKLDQAIADAQRADYPLKECPVSGEALGSMGEPFEIVYANRLVRFCCDGCLKDFHADPHAAMAKIDQAYADAQRDSYPLETCVVSGEELGSMGEPVEVVAGTRLVRFCCDKCVGKFRKDPAKYLSKLNGDR